ncbi:MAG: hypothetical protein E6K80_07650 [Candidatus Eisenbacteria bacterium]|uniref:Uncharacterized protein n=1 Tax=Eiseniibacteriota bacterium TaxID=2212470 RepID=A0A538U4C1_UNCEI|nr:MAG: hypothetical protein E6K80_07650 [Candidatus Eisenbacteria bacterium]
MSRTRVSIVICFTALLLGATCHRQYVPALLDQPVTLRHGQWASFSRRPLQIAFLAIAQDSRCPKNVQCAQAGDAVVLFQAKSAESGFGSFMARLPGGAPTDSIPWATWGSYRLRLLSLEPYPEAGVVVDSSAFVATFIVEKS